MNTPHMHAAVLRAIADKGLGAAQWQDGKSLMGQWNDCTFMITPITHSFLAWRIKPEPKPVVVRYWGVNAQVGEGSQEELKYWKETYGATHVVKLTFDGETGQCRAEVLP